MKTSQDGSSALQMNDQVISAKSPLVPSNSYFTLEVLLVGGFSILVSLGFWIFFDKSLSLATVSSLAFAAAFVVNHPHFLSSYILLYSDFRKNIFRRKRYFLSAVVVPLVLLFVIGSALATKDAKLMGNIITSMYFLVGWHYVKQVFGFVIVTSVHRKNFYSPSERKLLLANLFSMWFLSFLGSHMGTGSFEFYGIKHFSLHLPTWLLTVDQFALVFTLFSLIYVHVVKYIETGFIPSPPAVVAFSALYVWYIPAMSHPGFGYLIPFFHSLQYLTFVWLFKKNQVTSEISVFKGPARRQAWILKFGGFVAAACLLGALAFEFVPKALDNLNLIESGTLGYAPFLAAFLLFINIHHYFIDSTIWRSDNESVKKNLFS